eukprot:790389-Pyramimonas_sp.AAC.1
MPANWPLTFLLIELPEELSSREMAPSLDWLPREEMQGADDLSGAKTSAFDEPLRIHVAAADLKWHVLDEMTRAPQLLY